MKIKKMKKLLYLSILLPFLGYSQDADKNYVKVLNYKKPFTSSSNSQGNIPPVSDAQTTINYLNGFGKTKQEVYYQESNTNKDIVIPFEYDEIGRQPKAYLPYASSGQDGKLKPNALSDILEFYDVGDPAVTGNPNFETTANYYAESVFDNLNPYRVAKQGSPGDDWQINGGHEMRYDYYTNESNEVKKFSAITTPEPSCEYYSTQLHDDGYYRPGELFKTTTKTENWEEGDGNHIVVEYKDKQGRIVLKQHFLNGDPINTYYVYDVYGNLSYVLPPKVDVNSNINLDGLCYQYNYDYRNRLFRKKLPGKRWEYIIYDKIDRPILNGPVYSPFGTNDMGFIYTRYDIYNRVCYTGWLGADVGDDGIYCYLRQQYSNTLNNVTKVSPPEFINGIRLNYSIDNIPANLVLLSVNYYDDYNFYSAESQPTNILGQSIYQNSTGLLTGTWVRALTDNSSLQGESNTIYYDKKTNPIYIGSTNYLGGFTRATTKYNFIGQAQETQTSHRRIQTSPDLNIIEKWAFDDHGKLITTSHVINQLPEELISHNTYDALGNLITKNVGGNDLATFSGLQKIDFQYNVRGWLTKINDVTDLSPVGETADLFAFKISYNNVTNDLGGSIKPLYNGNISETYWRTANDNILRKYSYKYDGLNRLNKGIYQKPNNENPIRNSYNETVDYDVNGNIISLYRTGELDNVYETTDIDILNYSYDLSNPNRLIDVQDSTANSNGFKDDSDNDPNNLSADYSYDDNGNLRSDSNKSISNIFYNHLDLPVKIEFSTGDYIQYVYDASGKKLSKVVKKDTQITKTDYLDGFQYKSNKLQFFPTAEGYVSCYEDESSTSGRIFSYVYNYKDHLGNIRLTYSKDPISGTLKILEENHYYPFGLKHNNYNSDKKEYGKQNSLYLLKEIPISQQSVYNYKYSSKEWQNELGLNEYDFGARNYDPAIGRWMNIDPLAETSRAISPYVYALNNPIYFIDPDGMDEDGWGRDDEGNWHYRDDIDSCNYKDLGYNAYTDPGTIIHNGSIGDDGQCKDIYLGFNDDDYHYVESNNNSDNESDGYTDEEIQDIIDENPEIFDSYETGLYDQVDFYTTYDNRFEAFASFFQIINPEAPASILNEIFSLLSPSVKNVTVSLERLHHIFGKSEHALESLVTKFGSNEKAFEAVQKSANEALKAGKLTPDASGILPNGNKGNIINVGGMSVRLIGGKVQNGEVIISSFSRKGL